MAQAGIEEVGIIIAPETGDEIRAAAGDGSRFGVQLTYIVQDEPLGLAHAVLTAEPFLGDSPFVMYLGDNLLQGGIEDLVARVPRARARRADPAHARCPTPSSTASPSSATERSSGWSRSRREPKTDLALVGVYMFTPAVHAAARAIEPSAPRRARDHRRDPAPGRPRAGASSRTSSRAGGRTPAGSRTCSPPTGSCSTRSRAGSRAS